MTLLLSLFACDGLPTGGPCDEYVDYVCECHPEQDCEAVEAQYATTDPELEDDCEAALADLRKEDEENGTGCEAGDTGS